MAEGWIKLHRQMVDCAELQDQAAVMVWVRLLLRASTINRKVMFRGKIHDVESGQVVTSYRQLVQETGVSLQRLRTIVRDFAYSGMLKINTDINTGCSIVTICNFTSYQVRDSEPTQQPTQHQHSINTQNKKERIREKNLEDSPNGESPAPPAVPAGFREWWARYPLKKGKPEALKAYRSALKRSTAEELLDGLDRAIADWQRRRTLPEFVPHPATWLNRDGWADEHYLPASGPQDVITESYQQISEMLPALRKKESHANGEEFTGTHSSVPGRPVPAVWCGSENDAGTSDVEDWVIH